MSTLPVRVPLRDNAGLLLLVAVVTVCTAFWLWLRSTGLQISHENGPMENTQAVSLALSAMVFAVIAFQARDTTERCLYWCLTLHCLGFFSREVDLEDFDLPYLVVFLGTGMVRYIFLGVIWLGLISFFLRRIDRSLVVLRSWLASTPGVAMIAGAVFYLMSRPFDKSVPNLDVATLTFVEELLETNATLLMLSSALLSLVWVLRQSGVSDAPDRNRAH